MGDLTLVMTTAPPSPNQMAFVACAGIGSAFFAVAMWTWFVLVLRFERRRDRARAQTVPAEYPQTAEAVAP